MMNTLSHLRSAAIFSLLWIACLSLQAQITTDNSPTPEELVTLLVGPDVQVSNIAFTGTDIQRGSFVNNNGNLTIGEGIVLSTGNIALMAGPNTTGSAGEIVGGGAILTSPRWVVRRQTMLRFSSSISLPREIPCRSIFVWIRGVQRVGGLRFQ